MLQKKGICKGFIGMTKLSIEGPSAVIVVVPCHGMAVSILTTFIGFLIDADENIHFFARYYFKVVPLIIAFPNFGKMGCADMGPVVHNEFCLLLSGVVLKIGPSQFSIPGPIVFTISGRMNTHVSSTRLDEPFKNSLLFWIEHITGCVQKNNCLVFFEVLFLECFCIFSSINCKSIFFSQLHDGCFSNTDGSMPETCSL